MRHSPLDFYNKIIGIQNEVATSIKLPPEVKTMEFPRNYVFFMDYYTAVTRNEVPTDQLGVVAKTLIGALSLQRSKTVFKVEKEFADVLAASEDCVLDSRVLDRMPTHSFMVYYLNCEDVEEACIVNYGSIATEDGLAHILIIMPMQFDDQGFSFSSCVVPFNESITFSDVVDRYTEGHRDKVNPLLFEQYCRGLAVTYYMCAQNAVLNPVKSKKANRPKDKRGKPINIKEWDVTYREGLDLKRMYQHRNDKEDDGDDLKERRVGARKRPHIRRAHWHHFWVGKGRTELVVKWIAPVFVAANSPEDLVVTGHKV